MRFAPILLAYLLLSPLWAENAAPAGQIGGTIVEESNGHPVPYVTVTVKDSAGRTAGAAATDAKGLFSIERLPAGAFDVIYAALGGDVLGSLHVTLDAKHMKRNMGKVEVAPTVATLEQVSVSARRDAA